jgi:DNA polymerase IV
MKMLCALLPHFSLRCEFARNPHLKEHSCVLVRDTGSRKLVVDYSPELTGLQPNMTLQQALSRHDSVRIIQADGQYYRHSFDCVLDVLSNVSPVIEGADLGLIYIGMDGMNLIYSNGNDFAKAVRATIPDAFTAQIGIGESKFLAQMAARQCPQDKGFRALSGDVTSYLKDLSCDVLPVSAASLKMLRQFGLQTLGQIGALSPGPMQAQFGPEGLRIWKLSRGQDDTPLRPRTTQDSIEESVALAWVTTSVEALVSIVESLLIKAMGKKDLNGRGIASLVLWTRGQGSVCWEKTVIYKEPAIGVQDAMPRIKYFLGHYPQPGPVEQIGVRITRLGYGVGRQRSIFPQVRARDHLMEDIRQLDLRMGGHQVWAIKEIEPWSRLPERRYALAPLNP